MKQRYAQQRANATRRGIAFTLSFEEWMVIWTESGHLPDRGPRKDQYVMARNGDNGPYAVGNVKIKRWEENRSEQQCGPATIAKMSISKLGNVNRLGYKDPPETRAKKSAALKGNTRTLGHRHTPEECAKQSERTSALWANHEFIEKMRVAKTGKKRTPAARANMRIAASLREQKRRAAREAALRDPSFWTVV